MEFNIQTYNDFVEAQKKRDEIIKQTNINFEISCNLATVSIAKDIIVNVIPNKLDVLIEQLNNPVIVAATEKKQTALKELENDESSLCKEKESILSVLTSNLKQKKRVFKVMCAKSEAFEERYVAYFDGSTEFQEVLKEPEDIESAKRFLLVEEELSYIGKKRREIYELFEEEVKDQKYVPFDFCAEFNALVNNSRLTDIYSLKDLDPDKYYLFFGNEDDYKQYKESLTIIKEKYELYLKVLYQK